MKDISEQFIDYINGTLPQDEEHMLFASLTANEELRQEFRSYLAIDSTMKKTSSAFMPSADITSLIFAQAGLSIAPRAAEPAPVAVKASFFKSSLFAGITSGLTAAVFTYIIMSAFLFPNQANNHVTNQKQAAIPVQGDTYNQINTVPKIVSQTSGSGNDVIREQYIVDVPLYEDGVFASTEPDLRLLNNSAILMDSSATLGMESTIQEYNEVYQESYNPLIADANSTNNQWFERFSLEIRSSVTWNLPKETISPENWAKFNNTGLALIYNFNEEMSLGADVRQETFFARYSGSDSLNDLYNYSQQPNLFSLGLTGRYKYTGIPFIRPMLQLYAGGNSYGIIFRGAIGLDYAFYSDFSFIAFLEYSTMLFKHQDNNFSSQKLGMHYGINYRF